jgi:hypothetical protein
MNLDQLIKRLSRAGEPFSPVMAIDGGGCVYAITDVEFVAPEHLEGLPSESGSGTTWVKVARNADMCDPELATRLRSALQMQLLAARDQGLVTDRQILDVLKALGNGQGEAKPPAPDARLDQLARAAHHAYHAADKDWVMIPSWNSPNCLRDGWRAAARAVLDGHARPSAAWPECHDLGGVPGAVVECSEPAGHRGVHRHGQIVWEQP